MNSEIQKIIDWIDDRKLKSAILRLDLKHLKPCQRTEVYIELNRNASLIEQAERMVLEAVKLENHMPSIAS